MNVARRSMQAVVIRATGQIVFIGTTVVLARRLDAQDYGQVMFAFLAAASNAPLTRLGHHRGPVRIGVLVEQRSPVAQRLARARASSRSTDQRRGNRRKCRRRHLSADGDAESIGVRTAPRRAASHGLDLVLRARRVRSWSGFADQATGGVQPAEVGCLVGPRRGSRLLLQVDDDHRDGASVCNNRNSRRRG